MDVLAAYSPTRLPALCSRQLVARKQEAASASLHVVARFVCIFIEIFHEDHC